MGRPPDDTTVTDGELVRAARNGRSDAYGQLVRRWSARVLAVCHARVRGVDAAEDLAQETLLRAQRALHTLQSPDKFGPWVRGIARRVCLDWLKSKQTSQVPFTALSLEEGRPNEVPATADDPTAEVDRADELRRLMQEVERLPNDCRETLMLYYYHDVTYRDLADLLGVSTATVNARLTRARNLLRKRLSESRR